MALAAAFGVVEEVLATPVDGLQREFSGRLGEAARRLPVPAKARLIQELHRRGTASSGYFGGGSSSSAATATTSGGAAGARAVYLSLIANLLLSTHGTELTELKLTLDDLQGSLTQDFRAIFSSLPPETQAHVAAHIAVQGRAAVVAWNDARADAFRSYMAGCAPSAAAASPPRWWPCKVYSDYDDTQQVRLFDHSFPNATIYPGVGAFLLALAGRASPSTPNLVDAVPAFDGLSDRVAARVAALDASPSMTVAGAAVAAAAAAASAFERLRAMPGILRRGGGSGGTPAAGTPATPDARPSTPPLLAVPLASGGGDLVDRAGTPIAAVAAAAGAAAAAAEGGSLEVAEAVWDDAARRATTEVEVSGRTAGTVSRRWSSTTVAVAVAAAAVATIRCRRRSRPPAA